MRDTSNLNGAGNGPFAAGDHMVQGQIAHWDI